MLATSLTAAVVGVDAHLVRVEADTAVRLPASSPCSACRTPRSRRARAASAPRCATAATTFKWDRRITVSMAPASLRKMGSSYDLATAVGLLAADGALPAAAARRTCCSSASWPSTAPCGR